MRVYGITVPDDKGRDVMRGIRVPGFDFLLEGARFVDGPRG